MKILNGSDIAGYMKENQAHQVQVLRSQKIQPKLVIIRDNDSPVIETYVHLKQHYGDDIDVIVEDRQTIDISAAISEANQDPHVHGVIVQLPLEREYDLDQLLPQISPEKDVDGLGGSRIFESATATAINWLLASYDIDLDHAKIALIGRGRLVGKPLAKMWRDSGYDVSVFHRGDDLSELKKFNVIISATGVPHLIKNDMVASGTVIVDAGTASEGGVLVGDIDDVIRERSDLAAITPKIGGVGPLTVTALFEHVLQAAGKAKLH